MVYGIDMPKFYGVIGFVRTVEEPENSGVWVPLIEEREYAGNINNFYHKLDATNNVNDNVNISSQISIIADPYFYENIGYVRYVVFMGQKWKVSNIEPAFPRLIIDLGGLYNG